MIETGYLSCRRYAGFSAWHVLFTGLAGRSGRVSVGECRLTLRSSECSDCVEFAGVFDDCGGRVAGGNTDSLGPHFAVEEPQRGVSIWHLLQR